MDNSTSGAPHAAASRTPETSATLLQVAAERSFGALWDALGLAPLREFQACATKLAHASANEFVALAGWWRMAALASMQGLQGTGRALAEAEGGADAVASPLALVRVWLKELDAATQAVMLSDDGLKATSELVRAGSRRRLAEQHLIGLCSQAMGLPTREGSDEAFREIQQLKREVRRLKRVTGAGKGAA